MAAVSPKGFRLMNLSAASAAFRVEAGLPPGFRRVWGITGSQNRPAMPLHGALLRQSADQSGLTDGTDCAACVRGDGEELTGHVGREPQLDTD